MAEQIPAQEPTAIESRDALREIRTSLMIQNGMGKEAIKMRERELGLTEKGIEVQRKIRSDAGGHHNKRTKENSLISFLIGKSNVALDKVNNYFDWSKEWELRKFKANLREMTGIDPSKAIANIAGKAKDFAKDILSLLVKGGILFALYKLLEFLSEQDPKKLLEDAKNAYNKFLENYGGWVTAVEDIARTALLWSAADWLKEGKGPRLLWSLLLAVFSDVGKIGGLVKDVTLWASNSIFDITKGAVYLLWKAFTAVFGINGLISKLTTTVTDWSKSVLWTEESPVKRLWTKVTDIFDTKVKALVTYFDGLGEKINLFGENGQLRKLWTKVETIFDTNVKKLTTYFDGLGEKVNIFGENSQLRKLWTKVDDIFDKKVKVAVDYFTGLGEITFFDEKGELRKLFKFMKGIFGTEGKIAKGFGAIQDAEDFVGDQSDLKKLFDFMKGLFGSEGKIAQGFKKISEVTGNFFGKDSSIRKIFTYISSFFGPESAIGTASTKVGEFVTKLKNVFSFGGGKGEGGALSKLFGFIGGVGDTISDTVKAIGDSTIFKAIKKVFGIGVSVASKAAVWIGKIFAPIGWIMGFVESVTGFWDGFSAKKGDERTLSERLLDGLAGAINGLIQFIFIDTIKMIQDVVNFGIRQINKLATFELFGEKFTAFTPFEEVTFGDDLSKATEKFLFEKIGSGKLEAAKAKEAQIEMMESQVKAEAVTPIPEERQAGAGTITQITNAPTTVNSQKSTMSYPTNAKSESSATKAANLTSG